MGQALGCGKMCTAVVIGCHFQNRAGEMMVGAATLLLTQHSRATRLNEIAHNGVHNGVQHRQHTYIRQAHTRLKSCCCHAFRLYSKSIPGLITGLLHLTLHSVLLSVHCDTYVKQGTFLL